MKQQTGGSQSVLDSMVVAGVLVAVLYWLIDSILSIFFSKSLNLLAVFFGPDLNNIYTRVIVLCLLLLFGSHAQASINRLKRVSDALRKSEEEHQRFIENLSVGVCRVTLEYNARIVRANAAMAVICGYPSVRALLDVAFTDLFSDPSDKNIFMGEVVARGVVSGREFLLKRRDGHAVWVSCSASVVFDAKGAASWIDGVVESITERKLAEQALSLSKEGYKQILDRAPAGICEVDLTTGRFKRVNDVMRELTGYSEHELMSMRCYDILSEESRSRFIERVGKLFRGEKVPETFEYKLRNKAGQEFWADFNIRYHYDLENIDRATIVIHDITERKRAEEKKQRLQHHLYQAQKMQAIGTLAGGIAHDFNNLLMGIQGNASLMLSKTEYSHPSFKFLTAIEDQVEVAAGLTSQLLEFAQGAEYQKESADLNQLVREQVSLFGRTRKQIRIHQNYQKGLWPVHVDRRRIKQVVLNLCINAAQSMPRGGDVHLRTVNVVLGERFETVETIKPGKYVRLSVTDTGKGMDEATRSRIFEPFFTTQRMGAQKGIGLGLTITYSIVRDHEGFITVHSQPGKGTTFRVYLPAAAERPATKKPAAKLPNGRRQNMLIVEDEAVVMEVVEEMAKRLGFTVIKAQTGKEALELYRLNKGVVDLVVLDIVLPDMTGGKVYGAIRQMNPREKFLISTGYELDETIFKDQPVAVIRKPFSLKEFSEKIERVLQR